MNMDEKKNEPGLLEQRLREKAAQGVERDIEGVMCNLRSLFGTTYVHNTSITLSDGLRFDPEKKTATVSLHQAIAAIKAQYIALKKEPAGDEAVGQFVQRFSELERDVASMMNAGREEY